MRKVFVNPSPICALSAPLSAKICGKFLSAVYFPRIPPIFTIHKGTLKDNKNLRWICGICEICGRKIKHHGFGIAL